MNLGPNIKAAIARIAQHLPHLRSEGTAMPPASKDEVMGIKQPLSGMPSSGPRDPLINCAEQWVEKLLYEAFEADNAKEPETAPIAAPKPLPASLEPAEPPFNPLFPPGKEPSVPAPMTEAESAETDPKEAA